MKKITQEQFDEFFRGVMRSDMPSRWAQETGVALNKLWESLEPIEKPTITD